MSSIASFSGLASGIQWRDLIDQMMALERRPAELLEERIRLNDSRASAWTTFEGLVRGFGDAAEALATGSAFQNFRTSITGIPSGAVTPIRVSADGGAATGRFDVRVLALASAEKLGGGIVTSRTEALGVQGEFLIGGARVEVQASDSLDAIVDRINAANTGAGATGVTASVLTSGPGRHRLVLSADRTGAVGIDLVDGAGGALRALGLLDETTSIKHATPNGARGDAFGSSSAAIATLRGFQQPPAAGTVRLGSGANPFAVTIDPATMSLDDVAAAINAAAIDAGSAVRANVVASSGDDGATAYRLEIGGTTAFQDDKRILESLGILTGGRGAVAQRLESAALTAVDGLAPATAATRLVEIGGAGAMAGDTLTIHGSRADGTAVSFTYTIGADDTVQDLLDRLNDPTDGFGAGSRTATASIGPDGRIVLADDDGGDSRLALSIVAHNEGGGALDFGSFDVATAGRSRQIVAGADAELELDGAYIRSATNSIDGAVSGLSIDLLAALPDTSVTVEVQRDVDGIVDDVKTLVDAYNRIVDFVQSQTPTGVEGATRPPLSGESVLRSMQTSLRAALETTILTSVTGPAGRLGEVGVEIDRHGRFNFDASALRDAIGNDPAGVARLFGLHTASAHPDLVYIGHGNATRSGVYDVEITAAAQRAAAVGSGFTGVYSGDAFADSMVVRDIATGGEYAVELIDGMTIDEIVDALNQEFGASTNRVVAGSSFYTDALAATAATAETTLAELFSGDGSAAGLVDGTEITISGTRVNGQSFVTSFEVTDAASRTLGSLAAAIEAQLGAGVEVTIEDGALTARARDAGARPFTFSLSVSGDDGPGPFGPTEVVEAGRGSGLLTAVNDGGQLRIEHTEYGAAMGFEIEYAAEGVDGTASLGLVAGRYEGADVAGTIDGVEATGSGRVLTGAAGTSAEGLVVRYGGESTGAIGALTFSRGVADEVFRVAGQLTGTDAGSIASIIDRLDASTSSMNERIDRLEDRLSQRMEALVRRFTAMEEALARAHSQSQWLMAQLNSLNAGMGF